MVRVRFALGPSFVGYNWLGNHSTVGDELTGGELTVNLVV